MNKSRASDNIFYICTLESGIRAFKSYAHYLKIRTMVYIIFFQISRDRAGQGPALTVYDDIQKYKQCDGTTLDTLIADSKNSIVTNLVSLIYFGTLAH